MAKCKSRTRRRRRRPADFESAAVQFLHVRGFPEIRPQEDKRGTVQRKVQSPPRYIRRGKATGGLGNSNRESVHSDHFQPPPDLVSRCLGGPVPPFGTSGFLGALLGHPLASLGIAWIDGGDGRLIRLPKASWMYTASNRSCCCIKAWVRLSASASPKLATKCYSLCFWL